MKICKLVSVVDEKSSSGVLEQAIACSDIDLKMHKFKSKLFMGFLGKFFHLVVLFYDQFKILNELFTRYDYVIFRYQPFNILLLFLLLFGKNSKRLIFEFHTISGYSNKQFLNKLHSVYFKVFAACVRHRMQYCSGVTNEVAYFHHIALATDKFFVTPNRVQKKTFSDKATSHEQCTALMVASKYYEWNGLGDILENLQLNEYFIKEKNIKFIIVGDTLGKSKNYTDLPFIEFVDFADNTDLEFLYRSCSLTLAAFSLDKANLKEASTLKVRESLSYGIPVYSGHVDACFNDKPYYKNTNKFCVKEMFEYWQNTVYLDREFIANDAIASSDTYRQLLTSLRNDAK